MKKIPISLGKGHWAFIDPEKIVCIVCKANNVVLTIEGDAEVTAYSTFYAMLAKFPGLIKINPNTAINPEYISEIRPLGRGRAQMRLIHGFKEEQVNFHITNQNWQAFRKKYLLNPKSEKGVSSERN